MIEIKMNSMDGVVLMTAGKKIEENIKVTPVSSLILPEYDGAYELLVPTVSGVWVFNEPVTLPESQIKQTINLTTGNGVIYYGFFISDTICLYTDSTSESYTSIYYPDGNGGGVWETTADRTVDFGTEPQEVSEEFYAWLTANAVKQ